jgi:uncharacterized lipoprotein YddW (UPF0748 family)
MDYMKQRILFTVTLLVGLLLAVGLAQAWRIQASERQLYLPIIEKPLPPPTPTPPPPVMTEFRGLWVSRFDWITTYGAASPAKIDEIVNNAAYAGFNAILFQVRGEADAYYTPGPEPWARRLTGALGQSPGWDPLARLIEKASAQGIQVHAYLNTYPVWGGCTPPADGTTPRHLYHLLRDHHGATDGKLNGVQWTTSGAVPCADYYRASPASAFVDDQMLAVAAYLTSNYDLDGVHLDHIRYASGATSCDPVSAAASGVPCFSSPPAGYASYGDWQRAQVNGTVWKFYNQIAPIQPAIGLSAAVWPSYSGGYNNFYQDPKAWLQGGYIDMAMPMIYPATYNCPDNSFWTKAVWQATTQEYQDARNGRQIIPGIGAGYCTFDEIAERIAIARQLNTAGHAIFAYNGLLQNSYFDDLRNGPYAITAVPPPISR